VLEYVLWDDSIDYQPIAVDRALTESEKQRPAIESYCLVLTKDGVTPVLLDSGFDYNGTVKELRERVSNWDRLNNNFNRQRYEQLSVDLYDKLVKPVLPRLPTGIKNIVIVPDGELAYLPFYILREDAESPAFGETYVLSLCVGEYARRQGEEPRQHGDPRVCGC